MLHMADDLPTSMFVTTDWLAAHLNDPTVQIVDGSWYLPTQNRSAAAEFAEGHIPGAIFLDIDQVADLTSGLPHMLLDDETFAETAGALGIRSDATLVVYDGAGLFSAPRVRWMLQLFGAHDVSILQGGLPKWKGEGRPLEPGASRAAPAVFTVRRAPERVADLGAVRQAIADRSIQIVDARPAARFAGTAPEPRPGIDSGHMPGSANVPFTAVVTDGVLGDPDTLRNAFRDAGVDLDKPVIASCGSGVSAAILVLAMEQLGKTDVALYDGSWAEYAAAPGAVIEKG